MDLSSIFTVAAYAAGGLTTAVWLKSAIFTVPQKSESLVTFFGKHVRTEKNAGLHVKLPWPLHSIAANVPTTLQQVTENLKTKTSDDLFVGLPISIQFEVNDTAKFFFNNDNPVSQIKTLVSAAVRKYSSGKDFQSLYNDRDEISEAVIGDVLGTMGDYGVTLRRIVIDEPSAPESVQESYNQVRATERLAEAATNEAKAQKVRIVAEAEANKERDVLRGEGAAGYREKIFAQYGEQIKSLESMGVDRHEAVRVMLAIMQMDTQREVASHGNAFFFASNADAAKGKEELLALLNSLGVETKLTKTPDVPKPSVN